MNKIPTAEELFKDIFGTYDCYIDYDNNGLNIIKQSMKEFAELHVEAALKEAKNSLKDGYVTPQDEQDILNAYPLTNIK